MPRPPDSLDPVRVGIVGLGRAGRYHLERLSLRDDFRVVALHDTHPTALRNCAEFPARPHSDWNSFLTDSELEAVLIATPPATHFQAAVDVMQSGHDVLIETPLCLRVADADELLEVAFRTGRRLSVLHTHRWDDDFRTAQAMIAEGKLGQVLAAKWNIWQFNPRPESFGWQMRSTSDWQQDPAAGGGVLWAFGTHYFDQLLQLVGAEPVTVFARWLGDRRRKDGDDSFLAIVTFANGAVGEIEVHHSSFAPLRTGWIVNGTDGAYSNFTHYSATPEGEIVDIGEPPRPTAWDEYYAAVARHLHGSDSNPVTGEQARHVIALVEATRRSAETGCLQEV
ncbi:MAG: Gfo/Idh/MocA family oxidoreductase [Planctomycetales bacterium]|nr:Gfo/Idh/MocA family oxidoreductase [Planctomycetales bacterium]